MARWAGGIVLVVVALLAGLQLAPLRLAPGGPRAEPTLPFRETGHPVVLLVHTEVFAQVPASPAERPSDLEWSNLLTQVVGGCDVRRAELAAQRPSILKDREWIVLPRRTLDALTPDLLDALAPAVEAGAVVLLEAPGEGWVEDFGLRRVETSSRSQLTWPVEGSGFAMEGPILPVPRAPLAYPHRVERYQPTGAGPRGRALPVRSPTRRTLMWAVDHGLGTWRILAVHLGDLALDLRQGRPDEDFRLPPGDGPPATHRLAVLPPEVDHPWLDVWADALLLAEAGALPTPTVWPAPFEADGWVVTPGPRTFTAWHPRDPELPPELIERVGIGPVRLAVRPHSLQRQWEGQAAKGDTATAVQLRAGRWSREAEDAWAEISALGVRADLSLGPGPGELGWRFGSGMPFRPLGARGAAFRIWEIAHLLPGPDLPPRRVRRWLEQNARGGHGPILLGTPAADLRDLAAAARHQLAPVDDLLDFWEARAATHVRWTSSGLHTLVIDVLPPPRPDERLALLLPVRWRGATLRDQESTAGPPRTRRVTVFGRDARLLSLSGRPESITVHYRP